MSIHFNNDGSPLLLDNVSTGQYEVGTSAAGFDRAHVYIVFSEKSKGGTVHVEAAPHLGFAGQWAPIAKVLWLDGYRTQLVPIQGPHLALRVRVTDLIGGTVSVYGVAQ